MKHTILAFLFASVCCIRTPQTSHLFPPRSTPSFQGFMPKNDYFVEVEAVLAPAYPKVKDRW